MTIIVIMLFAMLFMWGTLVVSYGLVPAQKDSCVLGIALPGEYLQNFEVQELAKAFRKDNRTITLLGLLGCAMVFPLNQFLSFLVIWMILWFTIVLHAYRENMRQKTARLWRLGQEKGWFTQDKETMSDMLPTKGEKVVWVLIFLIMAAISAFLLPYDFAKISMQIQDGICRVEAAAMSYSFALSEVESVDLVGERPQMSKISGFDSNRLHLGEFRLREDGACKVFLYMECDLFIRVVTSERIVLLNGRNEEETGQLYKQLTEAVNQTDEPKKQKAQLVLFHNNPCESCDEEGDFRKLIAQQAPEFISGEQYTVDSYYIYAQEGKKKLEETADKLGLNKEKLTYPFVVCRTQYLMGKSQVDSELGEFVKNAVKEAAGIQGEIDKAELEKTADLGAKDADNTQIKGNNAAAKEYVLGTGKEEFNLLYFRTEACSNCEKAWEYLESLPETVDWNGGGYSLHITALSVAEAENALIFSDLADQYQVPDSKRKVPFLFLGDVYLSGADQIREETASYLARGKGFQALYRSGTENRENKESSFVFLGKTLGVGFLNGFNPCALSLVLLFVSLLGTLQKGFLKYGLTFLAGKFLAYVGLGTAVCMAVSAIPFKAFAAARTVLNAVLLILCVILSLGNAWDCYCAFRGQYGRIKVQLPGKLRGWNDRMVKKIVNPKAGKWLLLLVFGGSMVIALGEFFCTGQIYLASILQWVQQSPSGVPVVAFILYSAALCFPSLFLILMVYRGKSTFALADKSLKRMPLVKLCNALLFAGFAVIAWFSMAGII